MENIFKNKTFKTILIVVGILIVLAIFNPLSCVPKSDRGVRTRFGGVVSGVLAPGLQFKTPLVEKIIVYSIQPKVLDVNIPPATDGAITKDNQTVGIKGAVFYRNIEDQVDVLAKNFSEDGLKAIVNRNSEQAIKQVIGFYSIFDVAVNQAEISNKIRDLIVVSFKPFPIELVDFKLTNFDWSEDFDKQIKDTMAKAQEVKQKEQELQVASLVAQKQVKEAEAAKTALITKAEGEKQAAITAAEAEKQSAALQADAKALEGEGIRRYNQSIAATLEIQLKMRQLDIEMTRVQRWNGQYVPNNTYGPIPFNTNGGIKGTGENQ